ncbi:uncharacterized protein LOC132257957 [Phlebotomus argentipes]|uniref:uncharacterized protein LOC132257957 n=1 Tax=Phlebotomus argentipes TaxID=94469 RepID=UPI0028937A15|nr:uncharacterized protein LOC132257957 [Phlebotomus argentipes]
MGKLSNVLFVGHNGFKQFRDDTRLPSLDFAEIDIEPHSDYFEGKSIRAVAALAFSALAAGKKAVFRGFIGGEERSLCHEFSEEIRDLSCNTKHCLVLLRNGQLYQFSVEKNQMIMLNFISTEDSSEQKNQITHVACGETKNIAITNQNAVYDIPSKIHKFEKHVKIQKISCGHEHALLLTKNGDVYSWGNGLRGQLGHGSLENHTKPELIEALSGIKILDISAGGWHSAAVSAFGDLYTWGWNVSGQLGKPVTNPSSSVADFTPIVYCTPEVIDLPQDGEDSDLDSQLKVSSVACGNQHTFIKTECGKILSTGHNKFGQLGLKECGKNDYVDKFSIVRENAVECSVSCCMYCTFFMLSRL